MSVTYNNIVINREDVIQLHAVNGMPTGVWQCKFYLGSSDGKETSITIKATEEFFNFKNINNTEQEKWFDNEIKQIIDSCGEEILKNKELIFEYLSDRVNNNL